jgi:hypothetical protein
MSEDRAMRVVISLTTLPGREHLLLKTIESIHRQSWKPDAIYLWLPTEHFGPDHRALDLPGVRIGSGPDLGPAMKLLPTLGIETHPDTALITLDDDVEYPPDLIAKLVGASKLFPSRAIGFTGWSITGGSAREPLVEHMNDGIPSCAFFQPVQVLEGTRGILYRRGFFDMDILDHLRALRAFRYHDDILISGYLASRGITRTVRWMHVCPRSPDMDWRVHCQDSGLHTTAGWYELGWACWDYWSTPTSRGISPALATPAIHDRLQVGAETCPHPGFTQQLGCDTPAPKDLTHDQGDPSRSRVVQQFSEILALGPHHDPRLRIAGQVWEYARILKPGGILRIELPPPLGRPAHRPQESDSILVEDDGLKALLVPDRIEGGLMSPSPSYRVSLEHDQRRAIATLVKPDT